MLTRSRAARHGAPLLLVALVVATGCVREVVAPVQTIWEATLVGGPEVPDVSGSAASISASGATQTSISVSGLPNGTYAWGVYRGTCADPGDRLGPEDAYPPITVGMDGAGTAEAVVTQFMRHGGAFFVQVLASGTRVACGEFIEWEQS